MILSIIYSSNHGIDDFNNEIEYQKMRFPTKAKKLSQVQKQFTESYDIYKSYEYVNFGSIKIHNIDGIGSTTYTYVEKSIFGDLEFIFTFIMIIAGIIIIFSFIDYYFYSRRRYDIKLRDVL
jgi:hypothetical protein